MAVYPALQVDVRIMVKKFDLGQIIAILANVGVIASLVFVGVHVQQGATATRSATVLQLKDAWVQLNLASATSVDLAALMDNLIAETGAQTQTA